MKVDETYRNINLIDTTQKTTVNQKNVERTETARPHEADSQAQGGGTEVALSDASREVAKVREAMEASQPERVEKIEQIKREIAEGTYRTDSRLIAAKILGI